MAFRMNFNGAWVEVDRIYPHFQRNQIDVSSLNRPDTSWLVCDSEGHVHCWFAGDFPVGSDLAYDPRSKYTVPTLKWIVDRIEYYEDETPFEVGHHECKWCSEKIEPRRTADTHQMMMNVGPTEWSVEIWFTPAQLQDVPKGWFDGVKEAFFENKPIPLDFGFKRGEAYMTQFTEDPQDGYSFTLRGTGPLQ